ncbi:KxYKxGKxW signal peptide domain-containing protein [Weissella cibaria]
MEKLTVNSNKVDVVRRFRMYKDGKKWIVAGTSVLAFGLAFGINGAQVSADQVASDAVNPDAGAQTSDATTTITQGALTSDTPAVSDTSVDTETSATADTTKTPTDSAIPDAGTQTGDDAKVIASATASSNAPVATDASMNTETTTPVYTPAVSTSSSAVKPEAQNVSLASNVGSLSAGSSVATSDANAQFTYTPDGTNSYYGKSTPSEDINALNSMFTTGTNNSSTGNLDPAVTVDGRPNAATPLTDGGDADDNSDGNQATTKLVDGEDQTVCNTQLHKLI